MRNESVCRERSLEELSLQETKEEQSPGAPSTKGAGIVRRSVFWQFLRFCLVGGTNTAIDILTLNVLLWSLPTDNALRLVMYNSIAYTGGAVSSFFLNKYWTFRHRQRTTGREVRRFVTLLALEILYSNALVWLAGKALQPLITNPILWGNAAKLVAVAGSAVLSYAGMRFWAFAGRSHDPPRQGTESGAVFDESKTAHHS